MTVKKFVSTDVLVVGGGIAGCFAAIEARKTGAEVLQVDKGYVGSSGQSPYAGTFLMFDPELGHNKKKWIESIRYGGDYLANLDWTELTFDRSKECVEELISYGVNFRKDENGKLQVKGGPGGGCSAVSPEELQLMKQLRKATLNFDVNIMDRTMVLELLVEDEKVCGVLAMSVKGAEPIVIYAKSVILATGASTLKPPGWPVSNLTGDGDMMAYRAGVAITGKEFIDGHGTNPKNPSQLAMNVFSKHDGPPHDERGRGPGGPPPHGERGRGPMMEDAYGNPVKLVPNLNLGAEFVIHSGKGPLKGANGMPAHPMAGNITCASHGMSCHKTEGLWPSCTDTSTSLKGLYGAGDSLGTMMSGAAYSSIGLAFAGSAVTGKIAGENAGKYANDNEIVTVNEDKINSMFKKIYAPMERKGGFTPDWLITYIQNLTMPYFVLIIKHEDRLNGILEQVRYAKNHILPKLYVDNDHDLRLAIEAKNMIENLEIKLIASIARKESRGTHYREDYPTRDEKNYSGWNTVRDIDGVSTVEFHPMPKEWAYKEGEPRLVDFPTEFE